METILQNEKYFSVEVNPSDYKILVVDDVLPNVMLLKVMLSNDKYNVVTAMNGKEALLSLIHI